jgi:superfamily II DNA/RNA helicase
MNSNQLQEVLTNLKITSLNAIQESAIETFKKSNEMIIISPTGSGKTLAFLLPTLALLNEDVKGVQALILSPSRELALQIEQVFKSMGTAFKINSAYGGHAFKTEQNNLSQAPAILVGTPGRLADHIRRESFDASTISILILDEFDKALEYGFEKDMSFIISKCDAISKRILTSATKPKEIPEFTGITKPIELNFLSNEKTPKGLTFKSVVSDHNDKLEVLFKLLCSISSGNTLVFCNHRDAVDRISELLKEKGIKHGVFHGGLEQVERERALIKFRSGSHTILITTDLAARGLDIPNIEHVVHYQMPHTEDAFIHRSGRTARMHAEGTAYLVLAEGEDYPTYLSEKPTLFNLDEQLTLPELPVWETLYISAGKKDKINKVDIVGLILQKGGLQKDELGLIEVQDNASYVAIKRDKIKGLLDRIRNEKIKKQKVKMDIAR